MAIQLNTLSKNGILVGSSGIVLLIVMIITGSVDLKRLVDAANENTQIGKYVLRDSGMIVLYLVGILLCSLFIVGIKGRREWLMVPFLLVGLGGSVFITVSTICDAIAIRYNHIDLIVVATSVMCLSIIVLYPVCMLFFEIRKENIEERKLMQVKTQRA